VRNGNELSGAIRKWDWFFKCVNFGNGNGKDLAGMGGIENTENHSRTSLLSYYERSTVYASPGIGLYVTTCIIIQTLTIRLLYTSVTIEQVPGLQEYDVLPNVQIL